MSDYLDPNNEELLKDFFSEANQQIDVLEQNILVLENEPGNRDAVDEIFRAAHTLKGGAATVQMLELSGFTHLVEDVLDEIRGSHVKVNETVVDTLLQAIDIIKAMINARIEGGVYEDDTTATEASLSRLLNPDEAAAPEKSPEPASVPESETESEPVKSTSAAAGDLSLTLSEYDMLELREAAGPDTPILSIDVEFNEDNPMNSVGGIQVYAALKSKGTILKTVPELDSLYEDNFYPMFFMLLHPIFLNLNCRKSWLFPMSSPPRQSRIFWKEIRTYRQKRGRNPKCRLFPHLQLQKLRLSRIRQSKPKSRKRRSSPARKKSGRRSKKPHPGRL